MVPIHGITVQIFEETVTETDPFGTPIVTRTAVDVPNVLVAPLSEEEVLETVNLTGRQAVYQLGIPKGDTHDWEGKLVQFFGETWRVIGKPIEGIEDLIPLDWNKKVRVESVV